MLAAKAPTKGVGERSVSSSLPQAIAYLSILFRPRSSGASSTAMLIMLARPLMAPILAVHPSDSLTGLASISTPNFHFVVSPLGLCASSINEDCPSFSLSHQLTTHPMEVWVVNHTGWR
uniref:Uncharacterized protein n=1 Tax=Bionectria ochroleuca TaxID=29856 RepID=A0A8H7N537_BIOOC